MRTVFASILFAAAAAATATAEPQPSIQLSVSGGVDAGVVATSVAAELQRPVDRAGDTCAAPCLSVIVGDAKVTIVYTKEGGATRQRTVTLGADRNQWPLVITLLAGNLVRDEASDVLALVPQPPVAAMPAIPAMPPAPPEPPASSEPAIAGDLAPEPPAAALRVEHVHERFSPFMIGLVPGISTDLVDLGRTHFLSVSLVAGVSQNVRGLSISSAVDVARGQVSGGQISGAVAVAGDLTGVQLAGAAAVADRAQGAQIGGAVTVTRHDAGVQIAGGVTHAGRDAHLQIAGGVSSAERDVRTQIGGGVAYAGRDANLQLAGGVAIAGRSASAQIAGGVAIAGTTHLQIAGGVNVARHVTGLQIAPINIAGRVDGVQLGVINIGGGPDDESFGLINIVPGGRTDLEAAVDTNRIGTVMFRHGGRHWHNVYGVGGQSVAEQAGAPTNDVWMYGLGFGPSFHVATLPADLEVIGWEVNHGARHEADLSLLGQLRLTVGIPLGPMTLVAGGAINAYISNDHSSPFITARTTNPDDMMSTDVTVKLWPSVFVGARL